MNWFERYGIVGAYFLLIMFVWLVCCASFTVVIKDTDEGIPAQFIIGIFVLAFLPLGYILTVSSQMLYYTILGGRQIHRAIANILRRDPRWSNIPGLEPNVNEERCEAALTTFDRLLLWKSNIKNPKIKLRALEFLAPFCTRRFDVLAINNSIILSTILSPYIVSLFITYGLLKRTSDEMLGCYYFSLSVYTVVLIFILMVSNLIIGNQIIEINRGMFEIDEANALRRNRNIQGLRILLRIIILIGIMHLNFSVLK